MSRREQLREAGRDLLSEPQIVIYESNDLRLAQGRGEAERQCVEHRKAGQVHSYLTAAKPRLELLLDGESREETLVAASKLIGACAAVAGTRYPRGHFSTRHKRKRWKKRSEFLLKIQFDTPAPFGGRGRLQASSTPLIR